MSRFTPFEYQQFLARSNARNAAKKADRLADASTDESELHQQILTECKRRGWLALHGSMAHKTSRTVGEWDFVILADFGKVYFVEAKTKTGKQSPEQLALEAWAKKLGHTPHVVRSISQFLEVIQ